MRRPSRRSYIEKLHEVFQDGLAVCCMEETTEHWAELSGKPSNFYVQDSMGMVIPAALGIALSRPNDRVVAMEGDGGVLMNLGSLVTAAIQSPRNLMIIILNNDIYQSSGGQPLAKQGLHYEGMARGAGIDLTATVDTVEAFEEKVTAFLAQDHLSFVCAAVEPTRQKPGFPYTLRPPEVRLQFEQWCRENPT